MRRIYILTLILAIAFACSPQAEPVPSQEGTESRAIASTLGFFKK